MTFPHWPLGSSHPKFQEASILANCGVDAEKAYRVWCASFTWVHGSPERVDLDPDDEPAIQEIMSVSRVGRIEVQNLWLAFRELAMLTDDIPAYDLTYTSVLALQSAFQGETTR